MKRAPRRSIGLGGLALLIALAGCAPERTPPFLLLLSVDTLRADRVGAYGGPPGLTPHIDALMAESVVFENAFSTCSYTLPSLGALMTGRYPEEVGMHANVSLLGPEFATLASVLELDGWATGAVVSNYVLRSETGMDRGFGVYDDTFTQREANRDLPERTAAPTTDAALRLADQLLEAGGPGAFLWVHYQDPHGPYLPPSGRRERFLDAARSRPNGTLRLESGSPFGAIPAYQYVEGQNEVAFYLAGYDGEISYLDDEVGRLLGGLEERGVTEDAVIVFVADHGEAMGEADYWFSHGEYLMDPLIHLPLSIRAPGLEPGRRDEPVSQLDLFPTLLALFDVPLADAYQGHDLLSGELPRDREIYLASLRGSSVPRYGLIADGFKYLVTQRESGSEEQLFRLGDDGQDVSGDAPETLARMRGRLSTLRSRLRVPRERRLQINADERRRLEQLGYLVD